MPLNKQLKLKIHESLAAVLPVSLIVLALCAFVVPVDLSTLCLFLAGAALLILGMGFFTLGADMAMMPIGELVGTLTRTRKLWLILAGWFLIGVLVTVAEPDLAVLARQTPAVPDMVLILTVAAGVGLFLVLSFLRILLGFLLGVLFGTALAGLCWRFRLIDALARPLLGVLKSTPVASFIILALVWVKTTWLATVISFIMVLPLIYANVREGIDSADRQLLEMARGFRLSRRKTFRYCYLPAILPFFLSAISSALGFAWKSGIAAEVLGRPARAIGSQIYDSKIYLETPDLFAWTLVVILLSVLLERLAVRFVRWAGKRSMRVRL